MKYQHAQELSELRLGIEQVTDRELEMAKRLEDFIIQSQDQNAMLQTEVNELRDLLAVRDEQLASATFRYAFRVDVPFVYSYDIMVRYPAVTNPNCHICTC